MPRPNKRKKAARAAALHLKLANMGGTRSATKARKAAMAARSYAGVTFDGPSSSKEDRKKVAAVKKQPELPLTTSKKGKKKKKKGGSPVPRAVGQKRKNPLQGFASLSPSGKTRRIYRFVRHTASIMLDEYGDSFRGGLVKVSLNFRGATEAYKVLMGVPNTKIQPFEPLRPFELNQFGIEVEAPKSTAAEAKKK